MIHTKLKLLLSETVCFISQGTSLCQVTAIGVTVTLLYTSRACYNLLVLALTNIKSINSFDYDWYNVSDQVRMTRYPRHRIREKRVTEREKRK